ncbi:MAG: hypothetical protein J1E60_05630 [Christensenellaceae bacterium]|nr:hypothetical protein [Christensenellaceae bacterium]
MDIKDWLAILVPSVVTILSFGATFIDNRRKHKDNILRLKTEKQLSDLYGLQKDAIDVAEELLLLTIDPDKCNAEKLQQLKDKIDTAVVCFGSDYAVRLVLYLKELTASSIYDGVVIYSQDLIAANVILAMQLKYETTGIKTSPKSWYVGRFTSQAMLETGVYQKSVEAINRIVDELELDDFLKVEI